MKHAVFGMMGFSLRRRIGGFRFLGGLAIALLPSLNLVLDFAFRGPDPRQYEVYVKYLVPVCLYFVTPFVTILTMQPVVSDLYDKGSIGYLYTRPTPRWTMLLGLYLGGVVATLLLFFTAAFVPAGFGAAFTGAASAGRWLAAATGLFGTLILAALSYGAICLFFGVWSRRAILWAAGALILWGVAVGSSPGPLRTYSLHFYLFGLARSWCEVGAEPFTGIFPPVTDPPGALRSVVTLLAAALAALLLTARVAEKRDVL